MSMELAWESGLVIIFSFSDYSTNMTKLDNFNLPVTICEFLQIQLNPEKQNTEISRHTNSVTNPNAYDITFSFSFKRFNFRWKREN